MASSGAGRLFSPIDGSRYVFVPASNDVMLVLSRMDGSIRVAGLSERDDLVGPPDARARCCKVEALVGVLTYPDDRWLVVVTESTARSVACESGEASVRVVARTLFLPLASQLGPAGVWQPPEGGAAASPTSIGAKMRAQLRDLLEAGDFFFSTTVPLTHTLQRSMALRVQGTDPCSWNAADMRFVWNREALRPLAEVTEGAWITPIIQVPFRKSPATA